LCLTENVGWYYSYSCCENKTNNIFSYNSLGKTPMMTMIKEKSITKIANTTSILTNKITTVILSTFNEIQILQNVHLKYLVFQYQDLVVMCSPSRPWCCRTA